MKLLTLFILTITLLPNPAFAQSLQQLLPNLVWFGNFVIIPFLFGIAFLIFVYNAIRYFVIGADNENEQEKAKALAMYSIAAFVFLIIFWGIVNVLTTSTGLDKGNQTCPDYLQRRGAC